MAIGLEAAIRKAHACLSASTVIRRATAVTSFQGKSFITVHTNHDSLWDTANACI